MFLVFQLSGRQTRMWRKSRATCTTRPPVPRKAGWKLKPRRTMRARQAGGSLASQAGFMVYPRCAPVSQTRSKMPAAPMPVPMHMVTMPYLPPVRCRPCTTVAVRMAPVAPSG